MQYGGQPRKVMLMCDLTKYDNRCVLHEIGYTIPNVKLSMWGETDRFVAVKFDNGACMDVLWSSLEVLETVNIK